MKIKIYLIAFLMLFVFAYGNAQQSIFETLTLNKNLPDGIYTYIAGKKIALQPGFRFKGSSKGSLRAYIDLLNLDPNPYPDNVLGGAENGIVGKIADNFDVNNMGQAVYEIPISIPAGTGGMAPQLSVVYNSSSKEGLLGMGFDLGGLSTINRTPSNLHTDGILSAVNFTATDNFMLDGQRLIYLQSAGTNKWEYRTEQNSFSKVIAGGGTKLSPNNFWVYTKDGLIYYYVANTSISNENEKPLFWLLKKVTDTNGNYYNITYANEYNGTEYWPTQIDYTGNSNTGLQPYCSVKFTYINNTTSTFYIHDRKIEKRKILSTINIYYQDKKIKSYSFNYETNLKAYLLNKVTETAADGTKKNPTKISWHIKDCNDLISNTEEKKGIVKTVGNIRGNGKSEAISLIKNNSTGKYSISGVQDEFDKVKNIACGDFNGDGYDDLLINTQDGKVLLYLNARKETPAFTYKTFIARPQGGGREGWFDTFKDCDMLVTDLNGDGIADVFLYSYGSKYYYYGYSNSSGELKLIRGKFEGEFENPVEFISTGDFNGDGMTDIISIHEKGYELLESTNTEGVFNPQAITSRTINTGSERIFTLGDFNGDGKTDIFVRQAYGNGTYNQIVHYGTGSTFTSRGSTMLITARLDNNSCRFFAADINSDGKDDLFAVVTENNSTKVYSYLNNSDGTVYTRYNGITGDPTDKYDYYVGDFKGNGQIELLGVSKNSHKVSDFSRIEVHYHKTYSTIPGFDNLLKTITDGLGNTTEISYKPMSDNSVYQLTYTYPGYPLISINFPGTVVEKAEFSNGIGGKNTLRYQYKDARLHKRGRGILGFLYFTVLDEANKTKTETRSTVKNDEYILLPEAVTYHVWDENKKDYRISHQTLYDYSLKYYGANEKIFTYNLIRLRENTYDINAGGIYKYTDTNYQYDDYGNVTDISVKYNNTEYITTTNTYTNNTDKWHLGRLTKAVVNKKENGKSITRTSEFGYNSETGQLNKEVVEPGNTKLGYTKTYVHDSYGNITQSTITPADTKYASRTQKSTYDDKGRFQLTSTDCLGFVTNYEVDQELGVVKHSTDPNGIKIEYTYDGFGQNISTRTPLGNSLTRFLWSRGHVDAPANAVFFSYSESSGKPPVLEFFDGLERSLRTVIIGFDGKKIYADNKYNAQGQVIQQSEPYFAGGTVYWNKYEYDELGRTVKQVYADNTSTGFEYNRFTTITTDPLGQKDRKQLDVLDRLVLSEDNLGGTVKYEYDPAGHCIKVTGPRTVVETRYDIMGNRTKLIDPDLGTIEYDYNAYGELISQKDSHGTTSYEYDKAGRIIKETRPDGSRTFTYDTRWKGALSQAKLDKNNISESYEYDTYGRVVKFTETIDAKSYTTENSYDAFSRVKELTYPSGFKVKHEYNEWGYLEKVKDAETGRAFWQAQAVNARGQMEKFLLGNNLATTVSYHAKKGYVTAIRTAGIQDWSYDFNEVGNLTERKDNIKNLSESFMYDGLNRLWMTLHNGKAYQEVLYDAAGNIVSKSGVGKFEYHENSNRLKSVSKGSYSPPEWEALEYTTFNKVSHIQQGGSSLYITYGIDKQRKRSVTVHNGNTETRYYAGSLYEEVSITGKEKSEKQVHYIFANGGAIAIYEKPVAAAGKVLYLHKDHLGSVQAYSDESGKLVQELSYDAWGRRRNPASWQYYANLSLVNIPNPRGFTGHEHLDVFDVVNMNGRMYDPTLGRFLSPDPYVQAPDYTQGLNRYAYCINNPLSLVDPSGYSWFSKNWKSIVSAVVGITVSALTGGAGAPIGTLLLSGALGGMASGISGALLNGANIGQIAKSAVSGAFWGAVGAGVANVSGTIGGANLLRKMAAHSVSQSLLEGARGGNIKHGFISGLVSSAGGSALMRYGNGWSALAKIAANAVLSGTAAQLTGGKFANGAITGAYVMLFNHIAHEKEKKNEYKRKTEYIKKYNLVYTNAEDLGFKASYSIHAYVKITEFLNTDQWMVVVDGFISGESNSLSTIGSVQPTGSVELYVDDKYVGTQQMSFDLSDPIIVPESNRIFVGTSKIPLPETGSVYIKINLGYFQRRAGGNVSATNSMKYNIID